LGILGALGSCFSFVATVTIIPFMPDGWAASAGGFPAMTEKVAFLMKDLVLFAVSFYLLKQDVVRASLCGKHLQGSLMSGETSAGASRASAREEGMHMARPHRNRVSVGREEGHAISDDIESLFVARKGKIA